MFLGSVAGASIGLAGLVLLKYQGEFLEGLVYGDTGFGDYAGAVLWAVGLYFCSPYQLLLLFLGKIETERPSDWILQKLGRWTGQRSVASALQSGYRPATVSAACFPALQPGKKSNVSLPASVGL